jgi:hypothetical protein
MGGLLSPPPTTVLQNSENSSCPLVCFVYDVGMDITTVYHNGGKATLTLTAQQARVYRSHFAGVNGGDCGCGCGSACDYYRAPESTAGMQRRHAAARRAVGANLVASWRDGLNNVEVTLSEEGMRRGRFGLRHIEDQIRGEVDFPMGELSIDGGKRIWFRK